MKRLAAAALLLLAGCQGEDSRYDAAATAKARAVAPAVQSYGKLVSVGEPKQRNECTEARPFMASPCFDVLVTRDLPVVDKPGETTRIRMHVFVWLEREDGQWTVQHTSSWSPDIVVTVERPGETDSTDVDVAPPWLYGGYVQEPLPGG